MKELLERRKKVKAKKPKYSMQEYGKERGFQTDWIKLETHNIILEGFTLNSVNNFKTKIVHIIFIRTFRPGLRSRS